MSNPYYKNVNNRPTNNRHNQRDYLDDREYYPQNYSETAQTQAIIQVNGEQQAREYQIGANNTVAMFEQSGEIFYIKQTDNAGFLSGFKRYKYIEEEPPKQEVVEYVTKSEFESTLSATMAEIKKLLTPEKGKKVVKSEVEENG